MRWPRYALCRVAPPVPSSAEVRAEQNLWHLTLDQIESQTGKIILKRVAPVSAASGSTFIFDSGNVLYSKLRPYLNKVVRPSETGIATTELIPLRPRAGVLDPQFLTYYLRSDQFVSFASSCVAGAKMPRIIMAKFWQHQIPVPPLSEQYRIIEILDQSDRLRRLRRDAEAIGHDR